MLSGEGRSKEAVAPWGAGGAPHPTWPKGGLLLGRQGTLGAAVTRFCSRAGGWFVHLFSPGCLQPGRGDLDGRAGMALLLAQLANPRPEEQVRKRQAHQDLGPFTLASV